MLSMADHGILVHLLCSWCCFCRNLHFLLASLSYVTLGFQFCLVWQNCFPFGHRQRCNFPIVRDTYRCSAFMWATVSHVTFPNCFVPNRHKVVKGWFLLHKHTCGPIIKTADCHWFKWSQSGLFMIPPFTHWLAYPAVLREMFCHWKLQFYTRASLILWKKR